MKPQTFTRLLNPGSIAVIGGGAWCENVIRGARASGFSGPIWAVHPEKASVAQAPAFPGIAELPEAPDASFIGINRHATIEIVAELAQRGAGGAVCFASGFREAEAEIAGSATLQDALVTAAAEMPIVGPNCYGFINYFDGTALWPDQHGGKPVDSGVAIITQSSNIAINLTMQRRGLPIGYMLTAGNQAQSGFAEIGAALIADTRVSALGLHIEGVGSVQALEALAKAAHGAGKPIVVLKAGRSKEARSAALSHTASLAGSDAGADALFARLGIARVESLPAFIEALKLLHVHGALPSRQIAALSCSGGEASLAADAGQTSNTGFCALSPPLEKRLRETLGPMVRPSNPLDYHTFVWGDARAIAKATCAMMETGANLTLMIVDFPRSDRCDPSAWDCALEAARMARKQLNRPLAMVATLPENMPETVAEMLIDEGIAPLCGLEDALAALGAAVDSQPPNPAVHPVLPPRRPTQCQTLTEAQAKAALAAYGVAIPRARRASTPEDATKAAASLTFPLVVKTEGPAHKSDTGGVVLGLRTPRELCAAADRMPQGPLLIEEMVGDGVAELLVGVVLDPAHGYVLTLAAGGVLSELLQDSISLLVPSSAAEIQAALSSLRIFSLLAGYRGAPAADLAAVVEAVLAVQAYVIEHHGEIEEVEINPLIALAKGAVAVDALIRIGDAK